MTTDRFRLQPVLRHREILEDRARQHLADALLREREVRAQIDRSRAEMETLQQELLQRQQHGIAVHDLLLFEESIAHRGRRLKGLRHDLERAARDVEEKRQTLAGASRDRRLLEKFKEKKDSERRRELARRETVLLDEIALQLDRERG